MVLTAAVVLVVLATLSFTLFIRPQDVPPPQPESPTRHLDERKAAIYENLRDLQFEYRVGKLSDADYQQTKLGLQKELAGVLAEIDRLGPVVAKTAPKAGPAPKPVHDSSDQTVVTCPHCSAHFNKPMKFCGECGKAMA
jgi:hypothetical protein